MIEFDIFTMRIIVAIVMLGIATTIDIRKREISDSIWLVFGGISVVLLLLEPDPIQSLMGVGFSLIVVPLVLIVWRLGLFGGADALGLIVLSSLAPMVTLSDSIVTPFSILVNSAVLSIAPLIFNAIRNTISLSRNENIFEGFQESKTKKIIAMFLGHRSKNPKYSFSLEQQIGNQKKINISLHNSDTAEYCTTPNTWVTPGLPFMVFITAGFIAQLLFGDIILRIVGIS